MKTIHTVLPAAFLCLVGLGNSALAQEQPSPQSRPAPAASPQVEAAPPAVQPPPPNVETEQDVQVAPAPATPPQAGQEAAPPEAQWVYRYPTGQWVYTAGLGWVWVPAGTTTTAVEGVPYSYLYTPSAGWTWYVSPWGPGAYHYGAWVRHPWRPVGWRGGWVAHPRINVRLGGGGHWRGRR